MSGPGQVRLSRLPVPIRTSGVCLDFEQTDMYRSLHLLVFKSGSGQAVFLVAKFSDSDKAETDHLILFLSGSRQMHLSESPDSWHFGVPVVNAGDLLYSNTIYDHPYQSTVVPVHLDFPQRTPPKRLCSRFSVFSVYWCI